MIVQRGLEREEKTKEDTVICNLVSLERERVITIY
jgi:hypothetical protein